jgi:pimeloyl-ACP methyl ester carboxylesterase
MHGKGGSPTGLMSPLVQYLQEQGFVVLSLDMPWSGRRTYNADVAAAQVQVEEALNQLRAKAVTRVFLAGHSQGGVFALHLGGVLPVDGVIAIAPGGNVGSPIYAEKIGADRARAKEMLDAGLGAQVESFGDYEGSKGTSRVATSAANYWSWFDPQGAMNQERALRAIPASVPVLYLAPTQDYPALSRNNPYLFSLLAKNPLTRMETPVATHLQAPRDTAPRVSQWIQEVMRSLPVAP